jgi:hypothetical protein
MSDNTIRVPFRDRDDTLAATADAARALPAGKDRDVVRGLVLNGARDGLATAGDLLDRIEAATPAERRVMLDGARTRAGLPSLAEVDAQHARRVRAQMIPDTPARDEGGLAYQTCHAESCAQYPRSREGATIPVAARKWWCPEHEHLAAPGDLEPWTARIGYGPSGAIVFLDELERDAEIAEREAERRAAWLEERRAQRIKEWPALQEADAAQAQALMGDNFKAPKGAQPCGR